MDQRRFDDLARNLGASNSRRTVLKGLLAGVITGVAGAVGGGSALAAKGGNGGGGHVKPDCCPSDHPTLCSPDSSTFICIDTTNDPSNCGGCGNDCGTNACVNGVCNCVGGTTLCGGSCVDTSSNPSNCGACNNQCAAGSACVAGSCQTIDCDDGNPCTIDSYDMTTQGCVHTPGNDGAACQTASGSAGTCSSGTCVVVGGCAPGSTQTCTAGVGVCQRTGEIVCQPDGTWGQCTAVPGVPSSETCNGLDDDCNGVVDNGVTCPSGETCCGTSGCVDTLTDPNNCGACGTVCAPYACSNGSCRTTCLTDADCATGFSCQGGVCLASCPSGQTLCNGVCVNTSTDVANCGGCGRVCNVPNATAVCAGGICGVAACDAGWADCNSDPSDGCETNVLTDPNNCGACGTVCAPYACSGGACRTTCSTDADCATGFSCQGNVCVAPSCDDGNICTIDSFDASTGACSHTYAAAGTTICQPDACVGDTLQHDCLCDGAGSCVCQQKNCAPYSCVGSSCLTSCTADTDCAAGNYCSDQHTCLAKQPTGSSCSAGNQCISGTCSNGSCL